MVGTADVITSISVLIAAMSFALGVSAWKREFVGKRRIELVESVLAMFYEADDVIMAIRNPFSFGSEGSTRKHGENETPQESQLLDQAYVAFERYQTREKLFAEIRSTKYRFMAAFGKEAGVPFDELGKAVRRILGAGRTLARYYRRDMNRLGVSEEAQRKHFEKIEAQESIFWYMEDEDDKIVPLVRAAIEKIEEIAKRAVAESGGFWFKQRWIRRMYRRQREAA